MRGSRRTIAAAVSLLFLGAVFEAHLHRAFVRHGFCTAHGEPIHLVEAPPPSAVHDFVALGEAPDPAHGQHDCAALRFLAQSVEDAGGLAAVDACTEPSFARPAALEPQRAIELLELAPKGSPPA